MNKVILQIKINSNAKIKTVFKFRQHTSTASRLDWMQEIPYGFFKLTLVLLRRSWILMKCQMLEYQAYLYSELTIQKFCSHVRRDVRTVSAICNTNCYATKSVILLAFETYQKMSIHWYKNIRFNERIVYCTDTRNWDSL